MKIDKFQSVPLYSQIEKILENKIETGVWPEGYQLPTENELAKSFEVSNITIKRAIMNLVDRGMLYRQRAKGTFVSKTFQEKNIYKSAFFTMENEVSSSHEMINKGIEKVSSAIAKKLNIDTHEQVVSIKRLGTEDKNPIALEYTYIPLFIFPDANPEIDEEDFVYDILIKQCKKKLKYSRNYFSGTVANQEETTLLDVEINTPLFVWERITYSILDEPIEYSKFIMKQDKEKYYLEVPLI